MTIPETENALLESLFAAIDARDTARFLEFLSPDAVFRFGSAPAVTGHQAIGEAVGGFFASIAGVKHSLRMTMRDGETLVCEGDVTYTRHDGSSITLPFANVFELRGSLISQYKIYADVGPLYGQ